MERVTSWDPPSAQFYFGKTPVICEIPDMPDFELSISIMASVIFCFFGMALQSTPLGVSISTTWKRLSAPLNLHHLHLHTHALQNTSHKPSKTENKLHACGHRTGNRLFTSPSWFQSSATSVVNCHITRADHRGRHWTTHRERWPCDYSVPMTGIAA